MLSGEGGSLDLLVAAGGAVKMLPISLSCPLPLLRTPPFIASLLLICFCGDGSTRRWEHPEVNLFMSEKRL
jgi:hypothetical protein